MAYTENYCASRRSPSDLDWLLFPLSLVIYNMEQECAWSLEMEQKLAEVVLQREKWNLFWRQISYVENCQKILRQW